VPPTRRVLPAVLALALILLTQIGELASSDTSRAAVRAAAHVTAAKREATRKKASDKSKAAACKAAAKKKRSKKARAAAVKRCAKLARAPAQKTAKSKSAPTQATKPAAPTKTTTSSSTSSTATRAATQPTAQNIGAAPAAAAPSADTAAAQQPMLWGAWIDRHINGNLPPYDARPLDTFEKSVGKSMSLVEFSTPMADANGNYYAFPTTQMNTVRSRGSIPFLSWSTMRSGNYGDPDFSLASIIAGRQDAWIRRWATAAASWGKPFFLRFNWEMNGDWFPWGERYGNNRSGQFAAAWRHVHDIFTSVGASNATWVWCPVSDEFHVEQPVASLYPGDAYVDWTCMDVYNRNAPWMSFADVARSMYSQLLSIAPSKPIILGETGSTESGGNKAQWISNMFQALPAQFPKIRGLIWFDATDSGSTRYSDWPLDSSSAATSAFSQGVSSSRFAGARYGSLAGRTIAAP
jgi:hypothetical protein